MPPGFLSRNGVLWGLWKRQPFQKVLRKPCGVSPWRQGEWEGGREATAPSSTRTWAFGDTPQLCLPEGLTCQRGAVWRDRPGGCPTGTVSKEQRREGGRGRRRRTHGVFLGAECSPEIFPRPLPRVSRVTISVPGSNGGGTDKGESPLGGWTQTGRGLLGQDRGPSRWPLTSPGQAISADLRGKDSGLARPGTLHHGQGPPRQWAEPEAQRWRGPRRSSDALQVIGEE